MAFLCEILLQKSHRNIPKNQHSRLLQTVISLVSPECVSFQLVNKGSSVGKGVNKVANVWLRQKEALKLSCFTISNITGYFLGPKNQLRRE